MWHVLQAWSSLDITRRAVMDLRVVPGRERFAASHEAYSIINELGWLSSRSSSARVKLSRLTDGRISD